MGAGNTGPVAEFNIQTDPEAAKVRCGVGLGPGPLGGPWINSMVVHNSQ